MRAQATLPLLLRPVPDGDTLTAEPKAVEGSNGLLLEIDGQIVPNYDATIVPFSEGDVVSGNVVRIDKDEVLVDIGYKSEGVIPSKDRKSTRLNSSHANISYAVFCLKKKKNKTLITRSVIYIQ